MNTPPPLPGEILVRTESRPTGERDLFPDVARGAAIFGILLVMGEFLMMVSLILSGQNYFDELYIREWREYGEWLAAAYATGTIRDILQARFSEWGLVWSYGIWTSFPKLFGIFLFGLAAGRAGLLEKASRWRGTARKLVWAALPLGLLLSLSGPVVWHFIEPFHMPLLTVTLPMFVFGEACLMGKMSRCAMREHTPRDENLFFVDQCVTGQDS